MKKKITAWLLSAAMLLGMMPLAQARGTVTNDHTASPGAHIAQITVDIDEAAAKPWIVNMTIQASGDATGGTQYYGVLLRSDLYQKDPVAGTPTKITPVNYSSLAYTGGDEKFYRSQDSAEISGSGATVTMTFDALQSFAIGTNGTVGTTANDSFQQYTYVVFSNRGVDNTAAYAVGTFVVGADGFLKSPSYILHYDTNARANGSSQGTSAKPASKIVKLDANGSNYEGSVTLAAQKPTRDGYTFHGWDAKQTHWESFLKDPKPTEMGEDRYMDAAACSSRYTAGSTVTYADLLAAHNAANSANVQPNEADLYGAYTLYAQWRPIQVGIEKDPQESTLSAKVGVPFTYTPVITGAVNTASEGKKTAKIITVVASSYDEANPGDTLIAGKTALPPGLSLDAKTGVITGAPQKSWEHVVRLRLHIEDQSNKTTDEVEVVLPKIEKADQYLPEIDKNVGLETRVTDTDGQIFGFYSPGNVSATADGTGSSAKTYLDLKDGKEANIFEYLPLTDPEGKAYELTEWREIPLPESYYAGLPETAEDADTVTKADLAASMAAGAALNLSTRMTQADGVQAEKSARATGWGEPYGSIVYEELAQKDGTKDNFPVLHGLPEGAVYAVRFKANNGYTASPQLELKITAGGGGAVAGDSGYSVVFNLMGGAVAALPVEEGGTAPELTDAIRDTYQTIGNLKAGDEVTIPKLPEDFALMKDGQTSVTFHDGTKTYHAGDKFTMPGYSVSLAVVWSAKASPDDFRSVILLDWSDDVIGTVTINKAATGAEIKAAVDAVAATLYSGDMTKITAADYLDAETYDEAAPDKMLTYKKGYNFMGWVQTTADTMADTWTAFDTATAFTEGGGDALFAKAQPDTEDGAWGNLYLKAGYVENAFCNYGLSGAKGSYYQISCYEISRYGASGNDKSGNYALRLEIKRQNEAGYGVTRLVKPVVNAQMVTEIGSVPVFSKVDLGGSDVEKAEVIAPKGMKSVALSVVDESTALSYVIASNKASTLTLYKSERNSVKGFVYEGSATFISEQAMAYSQYLDDGATTHSWGLVAYQTFADMEMESNIQSLGSNEVQRNNAAKARVLLMLAGKGDRKLSDTEIKDAMKVDCGNLPNNPSVAVLKKLRKALQEKRQEVGQDLDLNMISQTVKENL